MRSNLNALITLLSVLLLGTCLTRPSVSANPIDRDEGKGLEPLRLFEDTSSGRSRALSGVGEWTQEGDDILAWSSAVAMSRDGSIIAVTHTGFIRVYKIVGSSWKQLGNDIVGKDDPKFSDFGSSISMSGDGMRIAIGDKWYGQEPGQVRVFEWQQSSWKQLGDAIDSSIQGEYGQFGKYTSMSDNGNRLVIGGDEYYDPGPEVFEWDGASWKKMSTNMLKGYYDEIGPVSMSGNGERIAVGYQFDGFVLIYEWDGNSWEQIGSDIKSEGFIDDDEFGQSLSMSYIGDIVAIGTGEDEYVRVLQWRDSDWKPMGKLLYGDPDSPNNDNFGAALSLSSDGQRIAVGSPNYITWFSRNDNGSISCGDRDSDGERVGGRPGLVDVYEWNGSRWEKIGETIVGKEKCDHFGGRRRIAMSGDGESVLLAGNGFSQVYKYEIESRGPSVDFNEATCSFVSCVRFLLKVILEVPENSSGDGDIDKYTQSVLLKLRKSLKAMKKDGSIIVSLDRLAQATRWLEKMGNRGAQLGDEGAIDLSNKTGKNAATCAVDFAESFINAGFLDNELLQGTPTSKMRLAKRMRSRGKWKKSVKRSLSSMRLIMKELELKHIPVCEDLA